VSSRCPQLSPVDQSQCRCRTLRTAAPHARLNRRALPPSQPPSHQPTQTPPPPASNVRFHNHLMNSSLRLVSPRSAGESAATPSGPKVLLLWGMVGVDCEKKLITYLLVCLSVSKSLSTAVMPHPLNIPPPSKSIPCQEEVKGGCPATMGTGGRFSPQTPPVLPSAPVLREITRMLIPHAARCVGP
jgi:hypothetical protein